MRPFAGKKEWWILGAVLLLAVCWLIFFRSPGGSTARLTFASGESVEIRLDQTDTQTYTQGALPVTVQTQPGRCRIIASVCPDHICEGFGWLSDVGQSAVCAPAGAVLQIIS